MLHLSVISLYWHSTITANFTYKIWDLGAYYSAVFQWSSIQGAFLFGVYAFFLSRSEPFIQAIAGSGAFKLLREYVVRTLYLSMGLCVLTLPMLVAPAPVDGGVFSIGFGMLWLSTVLLVYTFMCFLKVIRVFGKIERRS